MNERIRELAGQAGFDVDHHKWIFANDNVGEGECHELLEKFAELLIKEVTGLLDREQWNRGQDWICKDGDRIIERVESHFGVKE
jgi:hypothetical protein